MLLQILNLFPIHYITIFTFLIAAVLGVATAVVHAQYQHIVKTNNTMGKETKRKSRNGLLITFCIFAFISLLSFVFQKRLTSFFLLPTQNLKAPDEYQIASDNYKAAAPDGYQIASDDDKAATIQEFFSKNLKRGHFDTQDFIIHDSKNNTKKSVTAIIACCEGSSNKPSKYLIYSAPDGYQIAYENNIDKINKDNNPMMVKVKFDTDGKATLAYLVENSVDADGKATLAYLVENSVDEKNIYTPLIIKPQGNYKMLYKYNDGNPKLLPFTFNQNESIPFPFPNYSEEKNVYKKSSFFEIFFSLFR